MSVTRPTILYRFLFQKRSDEPRNRRNGNDVREKRVPIVEDFDLVFRQGAIVGHGVLEFQTRFSETPGTILARKNIIRAAFPIHVAFSGDVKYITCKGQVVSTCVL